MASESSPKPTPAQSKRPTLKHKFEGHTNNIRSFVFLHDCVHIVSGSMDGTMRKWDCDTGLLAGEPWEGKGGSITALGLSPDGKTIACGREDGSVQRWDTDGKMMEGVWTGHSKEVWSLSWSPSNDHIASGSYDGSILIRKAENGQVEAGPIETKQKWVAVAYSPSGDRFASGGDNKTICIWDSKTGKLVVGPIEDLVYEVTSLVWSSDSTKIYSASDKFACVFDNTGRLLHRYEHNDVLHSVALSAKNNVLVCVGDHGIVQLWNTESRQPLDGQPFPSRQDCGWLNCVSFSRDGRYLAYGGDDRKLTVWMAGDMAPQLAAESLSCLEVDATKSSVVDGIIEEGHDHDFRSSQRSLPLALSCLLQPHLFRRFLGLKALIPSRQHRPGHESISQERHNQGSSTRRDHSGSPIRPAITAPDQSTPEGKDRAGGVEEIGDDCFANAQLGISKLEKGKGKQREGSLPDAQNPLPNDSASPELNSKENDDLSLGKDPTSAKMAPAENCDTLPKVVGVTAARRFQSSATTSDALPAATHASSSSQASLSSQAVQFSTSSYVMSGKAESSFQDARSSATKNVVIFGQSGVGKSSIINLLAGKKVAKTSADRKRCTLEYEGYDVTIENEPYRIYDTAGVDSDLMDPSGFLDAVTNAHKLMRELKEKGGPHLLLYCMKAGRIQGAFATNYRLFYEFLFEKKVPVALVITHLEREDPMDQWYTRNKTLLDHHAVKWIDQACITADANLDAKYVQKYTASREEVGDLIKRNVDKVENWNEGDGLLARVIGKSKDLSTGRPSKSDVLGVLTKRCGMEESLAKAVIQRLSS